MMLPAVLARVTAAVTLAMVLLTAQAIAQQVPQQGEVAQDMPAATTPSAPTPSAVPAAAGLGVAAQGVETSSELDYSAWQQLGTEAETALETPTTSETQLNDLREQIVNWREQLLHAQSINASRIATLRQQISALGPVPAEGEVEAPEIATRRGELNDQLTRLQAPGIAAEEAYRQADGLISEIDRTLRERQTERLLELYPSPVNPANWPAALALVAKTISGLSNEVVRRWSLPVPRSALQANLPAILLLLAVGGALIFYGRRTAEALVRRVTQRWSARGVRIAAFCLSLGQILLPTLGVVALSRALLLTGMFGITGRVVIEVLPVIAFGIFAAYWLAGRLFPKDSDFLPFALSPERRAEGRFLTTLFGAVIGLDILINAAINMEAQSEAVRGVLVLPSLLVAAVILWRFGQLLNRAAHQASAGEEEGGLKPTLLRLLGRAAMAVGIIAPLLALIGYIPAASALIYPAAVSLELMGLIYILQMLVIDIYVAITRNEDAARNALVPVLISFALVFLSIPVLALIWGARVADLTEIWTRMQEGFQMGETRISPSNFLIFALLFAVGFTATRLFQGALKGSILPRTSLDQGARNALVSGTGYIGIFLAGLVAITAAGIDLSGLAIVAGALSVGIGFGMQNIVSNFVSGIILLIERPVSEGDWIEVGGVQGTVRSISVRSTRIQTFDRTDVIVPNTDLVAGQVTNWTRFNLSGRLIVPVGVAYGSDTRKVARILQEIAEAQPLVILNPPPTVAFVGLGADAMNFEIRMILRDVNFSLSVRSEVNHQIIEKFEAAGVEIPFAQSDVTLRNVAEIAEALLRLRAVEPPAAKAKAVPAALATEVAAEAAPALLRDHIPGEGLSPNDDEDGSGDGPDSGSEDRS